MSDYLLGVLALDEYVINHPTPMDAAWGAKIGLSHLFSRGVEYAALRAGWEDRAQAYF